MDASCFHHRASFTHEKLGHSALFKINDNHATDLDGKQHSSEVGDARPAQGRKKRIAEKKYYFFFLYYTPCPKCKCFNTLCGFKAVALKQHLDTFG